MKKSILLLTLGLTLILGACGEDTETVVVLTSSGYEPYEMVDTSGNLTGFDIELMEALAAEIGIEIEWKDVDFDGIIASLQSENAEIAIAGISPSAERALVVDFSNVYYNSESGLTNYMLFNDANSIATLSDLDGLIVGAQLGTVQASLLEELSTMYNFTVDLRTTNTQIIEEINAGRIDVLVVENIVATSIIEANSGLDKVILDYSTDSLNGNAIAFTQGSEYVELFNEALVTITDNGVLAELITKWFE
ncbi:MAG: Arginine-binding extracellular protein ArtP precursor [Candidatus Izimaplasma bacterium HR2]|nr:MAG: Arginine-binding extracellular protein ArtP precursor [Candidatus Izimaplasma bacterium HR2]